MRIFIGGVSTETNTFAPWPTGAVDFERNSFDGDASVADPGTNGMVARAWKALAARDGHEVVEGLFATAEPSGPTVHSAYVTLKNRLLRRLETAGAVDIILVLLHGAMVSTECDDCEGDLVGALREQSPAGTIIGVELDPHCHLSDAMVAAADLTILLKEYPHEDYVPRAEELYTLAIRAARGEIQPVSRVFDLRMVGFYPTTREPMAGLVRLFTDAEASGALLSASFAHGFPWGDTPDTGSKVLTIADGNATRAEREAERLGRAVYALRDDLLPRLTSIEAALDDAGRTPGRVILADTADNAGGGAPGDNMTLLRAILERGLTDVASGCYWDPVAVSVCVAAGVGATFGLRLGGKSGLASGAPLDLEATVCAVREAHDQGGLGGGRVPLGASVWVKANGVDIVITSLRSQTFAPDAFTGLGLSLEGKRLVTVKSSQHFETAFRPIADLIIPVATPGAIQMDFAGLDYRRRRSLNYHPRVADPLAAAE